VISDGSSICLRVFLCHSNPQAFLTCSYVSFGFTRTHLASFRTSRSSYSQGWPLRRRVSPSWRNKSSWIVVLTVESGRFSFFAFSAGEWPNSAAAAIFSLWYRVNCFFLLYILRYHPYRGAWLRHIVVWSCRKPACWVPLLALRRSILKAWLTEDLDN
jgi:hypothetical protein